MVTKTTANSMAKKPSAGRMATTSQQDDLRLSLNFTSFESEEDNDSDPGSFDSEDDYDDFGSDLDVDVSLEVLPNGGIDLPTAHRSQGSKGETQAAGGNNNAATVNGNSQALVPVEAAGPNPYDVDSDEEKDLLKGIKDEIRDMVRGEMQSELAFYQHKLKAIEDGRLPSECGEARSGAKDDRDRYPDLKDMEPKLRDAYIKMRKLDRILEKKEKKERSVKRDRILMERRIREEIAAMTVEGRMQRDIQTNTERYLSLALPPSHNQGVVVDDTPMTPTTPVFQTQVNEEDLQERGARKTTHRDDNSSTADGSGRRSSATSSTCSGATASTTLDGKGGRRHGHRRRKKDFIKRNKELAANANDMIAMTDDEKKRLQDLLNDIDSMPEIPEEGSDIGVESNPYQVAIRPGEGFLPSETDQRSLTAIDERLQGLMPEDEFRSIASSVLSHTSQQQRLFTRVGARAEVDFESYQEKALMETKENREFAAKMKEIEDRLSAMHDVDVPQTETPKLTSDQLDHLLDDCVWSMSRMTLPPDTPDSVDSSRTLESTRAQFMQHPPKLSQEMLEKLLSEAHFPMSSHLLSLQDDDSKSAQGAEEGGAILAETWKAIVEQNLSGDEDTPTPTGQGHDTDFNDMSSTPTTKKSSGTAVIAGAPTVQVRGPNFNDLSANPAAKKMYGTTVTADTVMRSNVVPHPALFDQPPTQARRNAYQRYGSLDSEDGRVSLPEISSTPLINTAQGGAAGDGPNNVLPAQNGRGSAVRNSSSLESMIRNDLSSARSYDTPCSLGSSFASLRGDDSPMLVEDIGEQGQSTPTTPHPPPLAERRGGGRPSKVKTPDVSS